MLALLVLAWLSHPGPLHAHNRSESFSNWQFDGQSLSLRFTVLAREATRIEPPGAAVSLEQVLADYIASEIFLLAPESGCELHQSAQPLKARPGYLQVEARWNCNSHPESLRVRAFFALAAEHTHFARFESSQGMVERILTLEDQVWQLEWGARSAGNEKSGIGNFLPYLTHGFRHIISGLDHVVFLLALLLVCRRPLDLVWAISGFTLGHSLTLTFAVLGYVQPLFSAIEATIGLTIVLVAVERSATKLRSMLAPAFACALLLLLMVPLASVQVIGIEIGTLLGLALFSFCYLLTAREFGGLGSYRIFITTLFGMVHGFGFASAFLASDFGSHGASWSLAAFNIGVELGQLALVAAMFSFGVLLRGHERFMTPAADLASAVICGFGVFWFVERSFG